MVGEEIGQELGDGRAGLFSSADPSPNAGVVDGDAAVASLCGEVVEAPRELVIAPAGNRERQCEGTPTGRR
jgi:hypothetical protein